MSYLKSKAVIYSKFGDPRQVLKLETINVATKPDRGEVLVEWLASPINPLDINRIQGQYAINTDPPTIAGSEGVGRVVKVGAETRFKPGDHVTIFSPETPFWTEFGIVNDEDLVKIDNRIPIDLAATIMVNPPTAWIMLKYYVKLEIGDYVIQNSANSGVGRSVIQLAKAFGYKTINIVRDRPNVEVLKTELWKIGADHVFTEEEFAKTSKKFIKSLETKPKLALNGVGGRSALQISSVLDRNGVCITYGGMSKKAHEFSTSALVFNDIQVRGVAVGMWARIPENRKAWDHCLADVQQMAVEGKLTAIPMEQVPMTDFGRAIETTMQGGKSRKQLLIIKQNLKEAKI